MIAADFPPIHHIRKIYAEKLPFDLPLVVSTFTNDEHIFFQLSFEYCFFYRQTDKTTKHFLVDMRPCSSRQIQFSNRYQFLMFEHESIRPCTNRIGPGYPRLSRISVSSRSWTLDSGLILAHPIANSRMANHWDLYRDTGRTQKILTRVRGELLNLISTWLVYPTDSKVSNWCLTSHRKRILLKRMKLFSLSTEHRKI